MCHKVFDENLLLSARMHNSCNLFSIRSSDAGQVLATSRKFEIIDWDLIGGEAVILDVCWWVEEGTASVLIVGGQ